MLHMRCFFSIISFSFFCLVSCRKNIQTFDSSDAIIEDYQPKENEATQDDLIICIFEPEAYTDFKEWNKHLRESLELDSAAAEAIPKGAYSLIGNFKIEKDGSISETSVFNDPGFGLGDRVSETIRNYKGKWQPAQQSGKNIISWRRQPVTFIIE